MKKNIASLAWAVISLWASSACTDDLSDFSVPTNGGKGDIIITTPDFQQVDEAETRSVVNPKDEIVEVLWAINDKIGIVPDGGRQITFNVNASKRITDVAVFDGRAWNLRDFATYYAYYPYSNVNSADSISAGNIHFPPVEQVIKGDWESTEHLGAADLLVGSGQQPENSALKIQFKHLCALVKFTIPLTKISSGDEIRQFRLSVPDEYETFIYDGEVDLKADKPQLVARSGGRGEGWAIRFEGIVKEKGMEQASFYGIMPPAALKGKVLEATLTTAKGNKVVNYYHEMKQDIEAGKAYDLEMKYDKYDPVVKLDGTQVVWFDGRQGRDSIVMVPISSHAFDMGYIPGQTDKRAVYNGTPIETKAFITNDFYIGETEVTQGQWKAVMGELPCEQPITGDSYPVVGMSRSDAWRFCVKLSNRTGRRFHLPSSAQWQLAAMSASSSELATFAYPGSHKMDDVVVYSETAPHGHMAMARAGTPNGAGLYHMGGNVKEFIYNCYEEPVNHSVVNYFGPAVTDYYMSRGASWKSDFDQAEELSQVTCPGEKYHWEFAKSEEVGLRVVCADEIIENAGGKWQFAYGYVDMGLPSGTLWASSDLQWEYPDYDGNMSLMDYKLNVMDGMDDSKRYQLRADSYFSFYDDVRGGNKSTNNDDYRPDNPSSAQNLQGDKKLAIEYHLGENWLTPSQAQWSELFKNTDMTTDGEYAILTSKINGKKLYFKLSGYCEGGGTAKDKGKIAYYWSSDYDPVSSSVISWLVDTMWTKAQLAKMTKGSNKKETDRWGTSYKFKMRAVLHPNARIKK